MLYNFGVLDEDAVQGFVSGIATVVKQTMYFYCVLASSICCFFNMLQ